MKRRGTWFQEFRRYAPDVADHMARRAYDLWQDTVGFKRGKRSNSCWTCWHPMRIQIDTWILEGRSISEICRKIGIDKWHGHGADKIKHHRDDHLFVLLRPEIEPHIDHLAIPYPINSDLPEKARWCIGQYFGIRAEALRTNNLRIAMDAIDRIARIEMSMATRLPPPPQEKPADIEMPDIPPIEDETLRKVLGYCNPAAEEEDGEEVSAASDDGNPGG